MLVECALTGVEQKKVLVGREKVVDSALPTALVCFPVWRRWDPEINARLYIVALYWKIIAGTGIYRRLKGGSFN